MTDGSFRDAPVIKTLDFPTYARAQNANLSNQLHFPTEINVPIACGGVAVIPGDVIVGDAEGVIVIPLAIVDDIARAKGLELRLPAEEAARIMMTVFESCSVSAVMAGADADEMRRRTSGELGRVAALIIAPRQAER